MVQAKGGKPAFRVVVCAPDEPDENVTAMLCSPFLANRVTYISNYSPSNAPAGRSALQCEVNWRGEGEAPSAQLTEEVIAGLERAGLVQEGQVLFTDRCDEGHAYIVYTHGFEARRSRSIEWLESEGILPLGRFGRYDYFNSDQCVIAARELAAALLERRGAGGQTR